MTKNKIVVLLRIQYKEKNYQETNIKFRYLLEIKNIFYPSKKLSDNINPIKAGFYELWLL